MAKQRPRDANKNALQELLERGGWHHLASVGFRSRLQASTWDRKLSETAHDWWLCSGEVIAEPHPVESRRTLFFDFQGAFSAQDLPTRTTNDLACRQLQMHLLAWLCDPAVSGANVTKASLQQVPALTPNEIDWLWAFLEKKDGRRALLERAQLLAGMPSAEKLALYGWGQSVVALSDQFQPNPPAWPQYKPAISSQAWQAFQQLMEAFYTKGLASGLPYSAIGAPLAIGGVDRASFVKAFRFEHRPHPNALDLCVLCGGELGNTPEVDHWISKGQYPLLSVCRDNLVPICHDCNSSANKGEKPVHTAGSFADWFHPYLCSGHGKVKVDYCLNTLSVTCAAVDPSDAAKAQNLDELLNLSTRWTSHFKAEYCIQQDFLRRIAKKKVQLLQDTLSRVEIQNHLLEEQSNLSRERPWYEVHCTLFAALLQQSRLDAWQTELGLAT